MTINPTDTPIHHPINVNIVFFGSSKYSTIVARSLHQKFGLALIVTQPDRPAGRERNLTANPLKTFAKSNKIEFLTAQKLDHEVSTKIASKNPDFLIVADYGQIIPDEILALSKYAPLNVHHSLLPKYRGPSPAPSAILAGEKISGVTIIKMTADVDAGPILAQKEYRLDPAETTDSLLTKLNDLGAEILIGVINDYLEGKAKPVDQDELRVTHTRRYTKEDGSIDLDKPPGPTRLDRMIRAFYPWPGVWTHLRQGFGGQAKIIKFLPGDPFLIQPEGKRPMTIEQFRNGYPNLYDKIKPILENLAQS